MAYQTTIACIDCGESKQVVVGAGSQASTVCNDCQNAREDAHRESYLAELDKLTVEERIRRIEEWIYDYKPTYVPPPRF